MGAVSKCFSRERIVFLPDRLLLLSPMEVQAKSWKQSNHASSSKIDKALSYLTALRNYTLSIKNNDADRHCPSNGTVAQRKMQINSPS